MALEPDIEIVGQAADAAAAVALAAERQPDVVLMDVQMPSTPAPATTASPPLPGSGWPLRRPG